MSNIGIGIDIGTQNAKVVCLKKKEGSYSLMGCGSIPYAQEPNKLKTFLQRAQAGSGDIRINIDTPSTRIRRLDVPRMTEEELPEAVRWASKDFLDDDIDEYAFRFTKIHKEDIDTHDKLSLVLYAIKNTDIQKQYDLVEKLGLSRPSVIEPNASALANAVLLSNKITNADHFILVDIGFAVTLFTVITKHGLLFSRPIPSSGDKTLTEQIARDLNTTPSNALKIKEAYLSEGNFFLEPAKQNILKNTVNHFYSRLAVEIQRSLDGYMLVFAKRKVSALHLCGGGAYYYNLTEYLTQTLGLTTSQFNPFKNIDLGLMPSEQVNKKACIFAVACGLAQD
ncbi:MAG: pilus assembly protein PilM [bacterium]